MVRLSLRVRKIQKREANLGQSRGLLRTNLLTGLSCGEGAGLLKLSEATWSGTSNNESKV